MINALFLSFQHLQVVPRVGASTSRRYIAILRQPLRRLLEEARRIERQLVVGLPLGPSRPYSLRPDSQPCTHPVLQVLIDIRSHFELNYIFISYYSPYTSADMKCMAAAFNTSVRELEDELMQLILDGQIQARIDSHNKVRIICSFHCNNFHDNHERLFIFRFCTPKRSTNAALLSNASSTSGGRI